MKKKILYLIKAGDEVMCYTEDKRKATFVANCLFHFRGFLSKDFEDVSINISCKEPRLDICEN